LTGYIQYYQKNGGTDTKAMGQTEPQFLSDPMSDRKKGNNYKKQHGARPCMEKMQLIFFVPPNDELEIAPPKIWMYPQQ
jgi:hypothetical protein